MVVVLVAARYQQILKWLQATSFQDINSIHLMKRNGPKVYLYIDTQLSFYNIIKVFHQCIHKNGGMNYVYQFYSIYNGMIDYNDYLNQSTKDTMPYYCCQHKDITDDEIEHMRKQLGAVTK